MHIHFLTLEGGGEGWGAEMDEILLAHLLQSGCWVKLTSSDYRAKLLLPNASLIEMNGSSKMRDTEIPLNGKYTTELYEIYFQVKCLQDCSLVSITFLHLS